MTALKAAIDRCNELCDDDKWQTCATCIGLLVGYDRRWSEEQRTLTFTECEKVYTAPLVNVDSGRTSRSFTLAGKIDKLVGGNILYDHKTTSHDISDPSNPYWQQLAIDSQATHYELLLLQNGIELENIVWDVVKKPGIRPKKVAAKEIERILAESTYFNYTMSEETLEHVRENGSENGQMFAARLARDTIEQPDKYFARRSIPRMRKEIEEYAVELWAVAAQIRDARRLNQHYRNSGACYSYNTPCKFLSLCSGTDTEDSDNWTKKEKTHNELPDKIGRDALSNSRLQMFQTCRRKHYYQYEAQIERVDFVESEALSFGTLWHDVLDTYWTSHQESE